MVWDVREIDELSDGPFDVVVSADNSLPHLVESSDLDRAAAGMWNQLATPGLILVTIRDYDTIAKTKPDSEGPRSLGERGERRVVLQLWDWQDDDLVYDVDHIILTESAGGWSTASRACRYRGTAASRARRGFPQGWRHADGLAESGDLGLLPALAAHQALRMRRWVEGLSTSSARLVPS